MEEFMESRSTVIRPLTMSSHRRRIAITGLGVVAPNGIGHTAFWQSLVGGVSAVDYITAFDPDPFPCKIAAEIRNFHPRDFIKRGQIRQMGRFSQLALAATRLGLEDARLLLSPSLAAQTAVCYGTSGGADVFETSVQRVRSGGTDLDPCAALQYPPHAPACHISIALGITGPTVSVSSNCCTGLDAIHTATALIQSSRAKVVFAGSCEAPLSPTSFGTFCALGALSRRNDSPQKASRPYDLLRDGLVMGEGAATLVLEDLDFAVARGAPVYAEILGGASASEAIGMRKGDVSGQIMAQVISTAIARASLTSTHIDHVNAHGSSVPDYDICDSNAFKLALGSHAYNVPITSIKSMIGQPFSAAGSLQAAAAALSIKHQKIPPTINYEFPDEHCDLDYVANHARTARINHVLVNGHSFGGNVSALVMGRLTNEGPVYG